MSNKFSFGGAFFALDKFPKRCYNAYKVGRIIKEKGKQNDIYRQCSNYTVKSHCGADCCRMYEQGIRQPVKLAQYGQRGGKGAF